MDHIRRLEKLPQAELQRLVLELKLRGYREVQKSEGTPLLPKQFFRQRSGPMGPSPDETEYWVIVWLEPLVE
ncbi:hypothetical protein C3942_20945 [Solimonas fluminis]|uniref:Uncharacterized protein n=1 Tax=Solimonas fluminis TaxID=2086571 RepID=A0A2S5TAH7_9GAMM|nr:hypothetical protein [Solimonas fluminis]PPE72010.1 hypothetical protein C3942_20945 [Solimonas fluminis]